MANALIFFVANALGLTEFSSSGRCRRSGGDLALLERQVFQRFATAADWTGVPNGVHGVCAGARLSMVRLPRRHSATDPLADDNLPEPAQILKSQCPSIFTMKRHN